jgi:hypothetical protein
MAVAAPARKTAPAPAPSRTAPPRKKAVAAPARPAAPKKAPARRPRTRPTPKGRAAAAPAPAPARRAPARKVPARKAPTRKAAPRKASARTAPARAPRRVRTTSRAAAVGGQLIPFAGRTAVAVGQLPDSGLMVRMTRGRAWIAVLGLLLVGIVALNVVTLSFAASTGEIDGAITALDEENSILRGLDAQSSNVGQVRQAAVPLGLAMPASEEIHFTDTGPDDVATAAARLAAAGG